MAQPSTSKTFNQFFGQYNKPLNPMQSKVDTLTDQLDFIIDQYTPKNDNDPNRIIHQSLISIRVSLEGLNEGEVDKRFSSLREFAKLSAKPFRENLKLANQIFAEQSRELEHLKWRARKYFSKKYGHLPSSNNYEALALVVSLSRPNVHATKLNKQISYCNDSRQVVYRLGLTTIKQLDNFCNWVDSGEFTKVSRLYGYIKKAQTEMNCKIPAPKSLALVG